jgi:ketosteroid isomerase-like protein
VSAAAELAIRQRRAAFNRALADSDLEAVAGILGRDVVLVTGTDSGVICGRKAQLALWKREFAARMPTLYVRTPETIQASPVEPIVFEHGRWEGRSGDTVVASGAYTAKWRALDGLWWVEAELYLTLA